MNPYNTSRLGYCERCGNQIKPVWCNDDKTNERVLSHGECDYCLKKIVVSEMTIREYLQLPIISKNERVDS